jgi:hypothetical protein
MAQRVAVQSLYSKKCYSDAMVLHKNVKQLILVLEKDLVEYNDLIAFHLQLINDIRMHLSEEEFWKRGKGGRDIRLMASKHGIVGAKYRDQLNQWVHRLVYRRDKWVILLKETLGVMRMVESVIEKLREQNKEQLIRDFTQSDRIVTTITLSP